MIFLKNKPNEILKFMCFTLKIKSFLKLLIQTWCIKAVKDTITQEFQSVLKYWTVTDNDFIWLTSGTHSYTTQNIYKRLNSYQIVLKSFVLKYS